MGEHLTPVDVVRKKLAEAGWVDKGVVVIVSGGTATLALPVRAYGETHELEAYFDLDTGDWRTDQLYLLGNRKQPCPLTRGMKTRNLTFVEAQVAVLYLPDMLVLRALACRHLDASNDADVWASVRWALDRGNVDIWKRDELFVTVAWMMANDWPVGDVQLTQATPNDVLVRAIRLGLRCEVQTYYDREVAERELLRQED